MAAIAEAQEAAAPEHFADAHHTLARLYYRDAFETGDWEAERAQVEKARTLWQAAGRLDTYNL